MSDQVDNKNKNISDVVTYSNAETFTPCDACTVLRPFLVWLIGLVVVWGSFLYFVVNGWPGEPGGCIYGENAGNGNCFCEAFNVTQVETGAPGVRQPVNTWSNLYSIITSAIVAYTITQDRKVIIQQSKHQQPYDEQQQQEEQQQQQPQRKRNVMKSHNFIADWYIFVVQFLGSGSPWYHGSLTKWGGTLDVVSMFVFVAYLPWYSIRRMHHFDSLFWLGYIATVTVFSYFYSDMPSNLSIGICVVAYIFTEFYILKKTRKCFMGTKLARKLWILALLAIVVAFFFWWASLHQDMFLCDPNSLWQPHGLLWHPLAGVTATAFYFYWREANDNLVIDGPAS